jgi:predicted small secreted protein
VSEKGCADTRFSRGMLPIGGVLQFGITADHKFGRNNRRAGTTLHSGRFRYRVRPLVLEIIMRDGKRYGIAGVILAVMALIGTGSLLTACNTVAGAGQDVSAIGNTVTSGATQTKRATGAP